MTRNAPASEHAWTCLLRVLATWDLHATVAKGKEEALEPSQQTGFQQPSGFWITMVGFWIPLAGFRIPEPCHSICIFFFYHNIKDNERNRCQDLLTIENIDLDLKVHGLHYTNDLLVRVRLSFQKLLQNRSTYRNNTKKNFVKRVITRTRCR